MPAGGPGGDGQSFPPARQISNPCAGKSFMVFKPYLNSVCFGLLDPDPDRLVRGPDPYHSIIKQK